LNPNSNNLDQNVFQSPTVFNYYPADYVIPGTTLAGPPFGILSTTTSLRRANFVNTILNNGIAVSVNAPTGTQVPLTALQSLAGNPAALVDELNRLLMHGTMSPAMKASIEKAVATVSATNTLSRARMAMYLVASSSQYQIVR
jgi:hypothetical protein